MEVRPGFKQTDIGVIPEDWNPRPIHSFAEVRGRVGWKGYTKADLVAYGPYTIGAKHINSNNRLDLSDPTFLSLSKYLESPEIMVRPGDVLIVQRGTIGKLVVIDQPIGDATINPSLVIIRTRNVLPGFLAYYLLSHPGQAQILADTSTTGVPMISQKQIEGFLVPLPPTKTEQGAIATALSDADAFITSWDQLITKKRQLKQGAMQELLTGRKRLPGFSGEWEQRALGEIATARKGNQLSSELIAEHGRCAYLNGGMSPSGYCNTSNTSRDTIAISEGGNSCGYVQFMVESYWCGGHCYSVTPNGVDNRFLYQALKSAESSIMALRVGSGLPNVQKTALLAFNLRFPKAKGEQVAIAAILSDMDAEIAAMEVRLVKAHQLKQGMMQELLSGRVRLI